MAARAAPVARDAGATGVRQRVRPVSRRRDPEPPADGRF